eukprot:8257365-Pyramimonas_sp.AAC.1
MYRTVYMRTAPVLPMGKGAPPARAVGFIGGAGRTFRYVRKRAYPFRLALRPIRRALAPAVPKTLPLPRHTVPHQMCGPAVIKSSAVPKTLTRHIVPHQMCGPAAIESSAVPFCFF